MMYSFVFLFSVNVCSFGVSAKHPYAASNVSRFYRCDVQDASTEPCLYVGAYPRRVEVEMQMCLCFMILCKYV